MAAMLAERGELAEARLEFAKLPASELQGDGVDLAVIYYPVSYTHLDVYKRQSSGSVGCGDSTGGGGAVVARG